MKKIDVKKLVGIAVSACVIFSAFTSCTEEKWNKNSSINVLSREDGSGTRGAFIELFGVEKKNAYIIGTGLAGLSAAFYLVRDGQMKGENIHLLSQTFIRPCL